MSDYVNTDGSEPQQEDEIIVTGERPKEYDPGTGGDPGPGLPEAAVERAVVGVDLADQGRIRSRSILRIAPARMRQLPRSLVRSRERCLRVQKALPIHC